MNSYQVLPPQSIAYFDHDDSSLMQTIRNSAARRNMTPMQFVVRKLRNTILARWAYKCPLNSLRIKWHRRRGMTIGSHVYIGQYCTLDNAYPEYVYIEDNASMSSNVTIAAHSNPYAHLRNVVSSEVAPVVIKEGAWIGAGAIILKGVTIGRNAIVCAGTVVDKDVPDCSMAKGNPMKIVAEFSALID